MFEDAPRLTVLLHALDVTGVEVLRLGWLVEDCVLLCTTLHFSEGSELSAQLLTSSKVGEHESLLQVKIHDVLVFNAQLPQYLVHFLSKFQFLLAFLQSRTFGLEFT